MQELIDVAHGVVPETTLESNERHAARHYYLLVNAHVAEPAGAAVINADEPIVSSKLSILQTSISGAVAGMASRYICKRYAEVWLWNLADSDELNAN